MFSERETIRKARTASEERSALFRAVVAGITLEAVGMVVIILLLRAILSYVAPHG